MKFEIATTYCFGIDHNKMLEKYPFLKEFETRKVKIRCGTATIITIKTMKELKKLIDCFNDEYFVHGLIFTKERLVTEDGESFDYSIEIYDQERE